MSHDLPAEWSEYIFGFILGRCVRFHKHHKIDGHIGDIAVLIDLAFIGDDGGRWDVVVGGSQEIVEGAMHGVVLARFDLYVQHGALHFSSTFCS